jgi:hypothetical protein
VIQVTSDRSDAGDVGRRFAERQEELNLKLTVAEVVERAGMASHYLACTP